MGLEPTTLSWGRTGRTRRAADLGGVGRHRACDAEGHLPAPPRSTGDALTVVARQLSSGE